VKPIRNLPASAELAISYISEEQLLMPTALRRRLLGGWLFTCGCERCAEAFDPQRSFRCLNCSLGEVCVASTAAREAPGGGEVCRVCGWAVTPAELSNLLDLEDQYLDRVSRIDATDLLDLLDVYESALNMFTGNHWVIYRLETLIAPLLASQGDQLAVSLQRSRVAYLERLGFPTYTLGWAYEELGDMLLNFTGEASRRNKFAGSFFEKAYWVLRTITGPESGYSVAIQTKWAGLINL